MRKRRTDAILANLPSATQSEIYRLSREMTIKDLQSHLAMPEDEGGFGVGYVSTGAISTWLRDQRVSDMHSRIKWAAKAAQTVVDDEVRASGDALDDAIMAAVREFTFDALTRGDMGAKDAKAVVGLILKSRQQVLEERKVTLLEQKARQADAAAGIASDHTLSAEEKDQRMKQIFGF